jgi:LemA protein
MELNTIVALVVLAVFSLYIIGVYNGIINRKNSVKRAWANVMTQERQKNKIIPELEKLVRQYGEFEKGLQSDITKLRSGLDAMSSDRPDASRLGGIEKLTSQVVSGFRMTMEAYPELKASELFNNLMSEIADQQEHIGASLRIFNYNVEIFNNGIQTFPNSLINGVINREKAIAEFSDKEAAGGFEYAPNL